MNQLGHTNAKCWRVNGRPQAAKRLGWLARCSLGAFTSREGSRVLALLGEREDLPPCACGRLAKGTLSLLSGPGLPWCGWGGRMVLVVGVGVGSEAEVR